MQDYPDMVHSDVASDSYFDTVFQMHAAVANRDYAEAARIVRENLSYIPAWIEETQSQQGFFDIASIPAFELGGTILALVGDEEGILRMRDTVYNIPHLARWVGKIREHRQDMELFKAIEKTVRDNPNCLQTDVHELVGEKDSLRVSNLISYLEKAGKIVRAREGRAYRLVIAGSADSTSCASGAEGAVQAIETEENPGRRPSCQPT